MSTTSYPVYRPRGPFTRTLSAADDFTSLLRAASAG